MTTQTLERRSLPNSPDLSISAAPRKQGVLARKGKRTAIVALARKLTGIMFAVWRDASEYNPTKGAKSSSPVRTYVIKSS